MHVMTLSAEFEAPDPPLGPGDIIEFLEAARTLGGERYLAGDTIEVVERTDEAPHGRTTSIGNLKARGKDGNITVWSNIEWSIARGHMRRICRDV